MDIIDSEDYKQIRKLRKVLRQIEHLQLVTRELNPEEKLKERKVLKRAVYRSQLVELNTKYAHIDLEQSGNTTFESSDFQTESSFDTEEPVVKLPQKSIENITEKLNNLNISDQPQKDISLKVEKLEEKQETCRIKESEKQIKKPVSKELPENTTKAIKKPLASLLRFTTLEIENAHEDLITCLDICDQQKLIATGSRDTTIKIWDLSNGKMLHSFGGHSSAITCIKFWPLKYYKRCLENIIKTVSEEESEYEEAKQYLDDLNESETQIDEEQLILSSSLDCSFRIWSIKDGACIRQFYLYNCINKFNVKETSFAFALDAGKIEYWNNIVQKCILKAFDDFESVREIQFHENLVCALTSTGSLKIYLATNDTEPTLNLIQEKQISNLPNNNKRLYKHFVMVNDHKILLTNGQSYLIYQDLIKMKPSFISNNSNDYGMSTCLFKLDNFIYASAYNIDSGISTVNVFSVNDETLNYEYTFEDKSNATNYCISTISLKTIQNKEKYDSVLLTACAKNFKIWYIYNNDKNTAAQRVRYMKLFHESNASIDSHDETDQENDDDDNESADNRHEGNLKPKNEIVEEKSEIVSCNSEIKLILILLAIIYIFYMITIIFCFLNFWYILSEFNQSKNLECN